MSAADALLQNTRAEQRRLKLQEAEREQQAEELEALKITEEQLNILKQPFRNVKFEFWDLDGLNWTKSSLYTRQYRTAVPAAWHAETTPATATATTRTPHISSSHASAETHYPSTSSKPTPPAQGSSECIDLTEPTKSSPSLNDYDSQATIRVKPSKPRTRKSLSRVYSSNEIQLENTVPVPSLGAQSHSTSATKGSPHPGSSSTPPNPPSSPSTSSSENQPSPKPTSRSRHSLPSKSRIAGAAIALAKGPGSVREGKALTGLGLGLRMKEPGSPGPMRDLDFNSNFNSVYSPSDFASGLPSASAFLDTSDLLSASLLSSSMASPAAKLGDPSSYLSSLSTSRLGDPSSYLSSSFSDPFSDSVSTDTYSTPPTPRFSAFDSFDTFDSPGDFDFDLPHMPSHPKTGLNTHPSFNSDGGGGEQGHVSVREAMKMELYNCLVADEVAYRTTGKFDPRPTPGYTSWMDSPFLPLNLGSGERDGSGGEKGGLPDGMEPPLRMGFADRCLKEPYEGIVKDKEEYDKLGQEAWAKKMGEEEREEAERRREVRREQRRQDRERRKELIRRGRGRDVYSVEPSPSSVGSAAVGRRLMDLYASLMEERTAARSGVGRDCDASSKGSGADASATSEAKGEAYAYTSPDIAYEDMLQDNSAAFYGVGRGVYDVTPANSCPPSPAPERYEFVY